MQSESPWLGRSIISRARPVNANCNGGEALLQLVAPMVANGPCMSGGRTAELS
jgi:hypothetical protein